MSAIEPRAECILHARRRPLRPRALSAGRKGLDTVTYKIGKVGMPVAMLPCTVQYQLDEESGRILSTAAPDTGQALLLCSFPTGAC